MEIHHVGYLVKNIEKSQDAFLKLGYQLDKAPVYDEIRQVNISFLVNGSYCVELVEPAGKDSPLYPLLSRFKNSPYHMCYLTDDLEESMEQLGQEGYTVFQAPERAPALEDRRVCFLINARTGIIELLEQK